MRRRSRCCSTPSPYRFGFGQSLSWADLYSSSLSNWKRSSSERCSRRGVFPPCSLLPLESGLCASYYLLGGTAGVGGGARSTSAIGNPSVVPAVEITSCFTLLSGHAQVREQDRHQDPSHLSQRAVDSAPICLITRLCVLRPVPSESSPVKHAS